MSKKKTKSRKTAVRKKAKKQKKSFLQIFLQLLVILLAVALIAFAASYVHIRKNKSEAGRAQTTSSEMPVESIASDTVHTNASALKPSNSLLQGTWVSKNDGTMFTINGNDFVIDIPSVEDVAPMKGMIVVTDSDFTVINEETSDCAGVKGQYSFTLLNEDVLIRLREDNCLKRSQMLDAEWFKL